jgi:hypothetical protein
MMNVKDGVLKGMLVLLLPIQLRYILSLTLKSLQKDALVYICVFLILNAGKKSFLCYFRQHPQAN